MRKWVGEALGTFILVFGGCGTAVFAAKFPGWASACSASPSPSA